MNISLRVLPRRKLVPGFVLLMLLLSPLVACTRQADVPKEPPERVTIAYPRSFYAVLFSVAHAKDYFKDEGLEVTPQFHEFGKVAVNAMLEGKADMAVSGDTVAMFAIAAGRNISILAESMTSNRNEAIVARRDRGIGAPRDLAGKRIGVALGTTGHFFLDSFLIVNGIDREKVSVVNLKPGDMMPALGLGTVDAVAIWQPVMKLLERGLGERGVLFYDERVYSDIVCLSAAREYAERHPDTVRKVLHALVKAENFVKENPADARRLAAEFLNFDLTVLTEVWGSLTFAVTLDQSLLVSLEDQTRWAQQGGLLPSGARLRYLDFIYSDGLQAVRPDAVRIIR